MATLVLDTPTSNQRLTTTMRYSFITKDWEENENAREDFVAPILTRDRTKFSSSMYVSFFSFELFYLILMFIS